MAQTGDDFRNKFAKAAEMLIQAAEKRHTAGFLVAKSVERMKEKFNDFRAAIPDDPQELGMDEMAKWVAFVEEAEKAGLMPPEMTARLKDIHNMLNK